MDALTALQKRVSCPRLTEPAPRGDILTNICKAALRAADHANLRPWRFLVIEGKAREALGQVFVAAAEQDDPDLSQAQRQRIKEKPLRAPMILVAIAHCRDNLKVPGCEQLISTGAAVQNMITAAFAQSVGAYWRTGSMAYHPKVAEGLGLAENEKIVGFVYMGTPVGTLKEVPELTPEAFFTTWTQN